MKPIPQDMPCCPLCDNAIMSHEPAMIWYAGGVKALVHLDCVEEHDWDEVDEEDRDENDESE